MLQFPQHRVAGATAHGHLNLRYTHIGDDPTKVYRLSYKYMESGTHDIIMMMTMMMMITTTTTTTTTIIIIIIIVIVIILSSYL